LSTEQPPEKSRVPQPIRVGGGFLFVYAALAIAFAGTAAYLVLVRQEPLTSPQVAVCGLGALWFALRTAMAFTVRK
jgi:hypothetical protein